MFNISLENPEVREIDFCLSKLKAFHFGWLLPYLCITYLMVLHLHCTVDFRFDFFQTIVRTLWCDWRKLHQFWILFSWFHHFWTKILDSKSFALGESYFFVQKGVGWANIYWYWSYALRLRLKVRVWQKCQTRVKKFQTTTINLVLGTRVPCYIHLILQ